MLNISKNLIKRNVGVIKNPTKRRVKSIFLGIVGKCLIFAYIIILPALTK